jgi:hypothetical protein
VHDRRLLDDGHPRDLDGPAGAAERMGGRVDRRRRHARDACDAAQRFLKKLDAARRLRVLALGQRHSEREDAIGTEAEFHAPDRERGPDHQARADHQHDGERHGADHQALAKQRLR